MSSPDNIEGNRFGGYRSQREMAEADDKWRASAHLPEYRVTRRSGKVANVRAHTEREARTTVMQAFPDDPIAYVEAVGWVDGLTS